MYCTQADILEQLQESDLIALTDDAGSGDADETVLARAIEDAEAEIDSYCGGNYTVPFSPIPKMIRKIAVDMTIYNLFSRRQGAPEDRKQRYDASVKFLVNVSKGLIALGTSEISAPVSDDSGPEAVTPDGGRIFTRDTLRGY